MSETRETEQQVEQTEEQVAAETPEQQEEQQEQKPQRRPWYMERIDQQTRRASEATARSEDLAKQVQALRASMEALVSGKPAHQEGQERTFTQAELQAEAQRMAAIEAQRIIEQTSENDFTIRCNEVAAVGRRQFDDFDAMRDNLVAMGVLNAERGQRSFLEGVIELPNAAAVLHKLGSEPEEALRFVRMRPMALAIALSDLSREVKAAAEKAEAEPAERRPQPRVSNAPRPVTRVDGNAAPRTRAIDDKDLPMEEFIRMREESEKSRTRH